MKKNAMPFQQEDVESLTWGWVFILLIFLCLELTACRGETVMTRGELLAGTEDVSPSSPLGTSPDSNWLLYRSREASRTPRLVLLHLPDLVRKEVVFSENALPKVQRNNTPWLSCIVWDMTSDQVFLGGDTYVGFKASFSEPEPQWDALFEAIPECQQSLIPVRLKRNGETEVQVLGAGQNQILATHEMPEGPHHQLTIRDLSVSPDGNRLIYVVQQHRGSHAAPPQVWLMDLNRSSPSRYLGEHLYSRAHWVSDSSFLGVGRTRSGTAGVFEWHLK